MEQRVAPILEPHGALRSDAPLVLQGHMLFPGDPIAAKRYPEDIEREMAIVSQVLGDDDAYPHSSIIDDDLPMSVMAKHLLKKTNEQSVKGWGVGQVALRFVQLTDRWEAPSLNKAISLTSMQWREESGAGKKFVRKQVANGADSEKAEEAADEYFQDRLRRLWREFWPVAHFWASNCFLDDGERVSLGIGGSEFVGFLRFASFFERRLSLIADSGPAQMKLRAGDLLSVPSKFPEPIPELMSDPLRPKDIEHLRSYKALYR
ncbi:hypothetical protein [Thioclava sp. JE_KL1]|uniref:hypothetical protein n=1 Tax=Thioclava sp. JE_KL1 TaxID=2651187 RepID=UPI00128DC9F2|nr:hypothetical protein [Thioclava sp. JE_KL1]MPQ95941.1 hypothetical protein [Thioclava sp. JE_KL1]